MPLTIPYPCVIIQELPTHPMIRAIAGAHCPTCSDGVYNGDEGGVDCGGSCTKKCPLYDFTSFKFLPIVSEQRDGPTYSQMKSAYAGQVWLHDSGMVNTTEDHSVNTTEDHSVY